MKRKTISIITGIVVITIIIATITIFLFHSSIHQEKEDSEELEPRKHHKMESGSGGSHKGSCSASCGGGVDGKTKIDPLSDPAYNVKESIKQSILLEEHLAQKQKRCEDCSVKHFLHIIGLLEEAIWLATTNLPKFPLLEESAKLYNDLYQEYLKNKHNEVGLERILEKLREHRKKLVKIYINNDHPPSASG